MTILWWLIFIVLLTVFVVLHAVVLPKAFLTVDFGKVAVPDRAIKKIMEEGGISLLYEPALKIRKYVPQYVLSERNGKKCAVCKTSDSVRWLDYDIAVFNNENRVFKVLNVKEAVDGKGITREVQLPQETAYVTIMLNGVNNLKNKSSLTRRVFAKKLLAYLLISVLVEAFAVAGIKVCLANMFGGLYAESFLYNIQSWKVTAVVCAAVCIINVLVTLIVLKCKSISKKPEADDNA